MKMTQKDLILKYIDEYGSITPMDAFTDLGITKLATRISEMRKAGMEFQKIPETGVNRFGNPVCYMRYKKGVQ